MAYLINESNQNQLKRKIRLQCHKIWKDSPQLYIEEEDKLQPAPSHQLEAGMG
jgi:hypothetical protein